MPPVSTGLILLKIFGRRSPLGQWLYERGIEIVFNWKGVLIAMSVMSFPLLVRSVRTSFAEVNPRLEQIAATLGASPLRIFFVITIPLAYKGIVAGALLAFSRALGEFGATILLAGNIPGKTQTLSLAIYNYVQLGKDSDAYVLLGITVALAFLFVWCSEWLLRSGKKAEMILRCRIPLASFELDIDASFDARVTAIFGPSGSGKTTLLDAVAGLRRIVDGDDRDRRPNTLLLGAENQSSAPAKRHRLRAARRRVVSASFGAKKYSFRRRARLREIQSHQHGPCARTFWRSAICWTVPSPIFPAEKRNESRSPELFFRDRNCSCWMNRWPLSISA